MIVYVYTFPNGKKYIGQTIQTLAQRAQGGQGYKLQPLVYRAIQKYGWENILIETFECKSEEEMDLLEKDLIAQYNTTNRDYGYNLEDGVHIGKHHSESTKMKISESVKGEKHPFFGTHRSEVTKQKLRDFRTGTHLSEETKQKISEGNKGKSGYWSGKTFSVEHKQHIGDSVKGERNGMYGKNHSSEAKRKISEANSTKVICLETLNIYPSIVAASKAVGLSASAISAVIHGKNKTASGLHWMKLDDYKKQYGDIK